MHGLGDDEAEVVGEAVPKPLLPVRGGIGMTERGLHPDVAIAHFDRACRHVVRPQVEGAAAFEIEAGVVPMTGQDTVLDAAALEREPHVRATIVESEDASAVVDDEDRTMATVHNEPPFRLELLEASREREFLVGRVHEHTSRSCPCCRYPRSTINIGILSRKRARPPWCRLGADCETPSVATACHGNSRTYRCRDADTETPTLIAPTKRRKEQWTSNEAVRSHPAKGRRTISPARFAWTRCSRRPSRHGSPAPASRSSRVPAPHGIPIRSARL